MGRRNRVLTSFFLCVGLPYLASLFSQYSGIDLFVSLAEASLLVALWAAFDLMKINRQIANESVALDAKYEAKMQQLIKEAAPNRQTTH